MCHHVVSCLAGGRASTSLARPHGDSDFGDVDSAFPGSDGPSPPSGGHPVTRRPGGWRASRALCATCVSLGGARRQGRFRVTARPPARLVGCGETAQERASEPWYAHQRTRGWAYVHPVGVDLPTRQSTVFGEDVCAHLRLVRGCQRRLPTAASRVPEAARRHSRRQWCGQAG